MKDIARDLGISPMAVSKALRNHRDISAETKARVLQRAAELNYRVNMVARSMITGRTYLVGLVVPDLMQSFFSEVASSLSAALAPAGYHVLICNTNEDSRSEVENIELLVSRNIDGLVIASAQRTTRMLSTLTTPLVTVDRHIPQLNAIYVGSDDEQIGVIATEHLIDQGCRAIVHLAGTGASPGRGRIAGFHRALKGRTNGSVDGRVVDAGYDSGSGYRAMKAFLDEGARPDGIFCFNDPVAIGAMRAVAEAGLRIPQDVAIVGVANMQLTDMLQVPLTTVDQGTSAIGERAAHLLLNEMGVEGASEPQHILLPPRLIVRQSSNRRAPLAEAD